jgi:hypothetical protein
VRKEDKNPLLLQHPQARNKRRVRFWSRCTGCTHYVADEAPQTVDREKTASNDQESMLQIVDEEKETTDTGT